MFRLMGKKIIKFYANKISLSGSMSIIIFFGLSLNLRPRGLVFALNDQKFMYTYLLREFKHSENIYESFVCLFLMLYVPSQQLWSLQDGYI